MQQTMLIMAAALLATEFAINKIYQQKYGSSPEISLRFASISGLFKAIVFFIINKFEMDFTAYSFIMAMLMNCLVMSYTIIGFKLLSASSVAMYTLFLMTGGMTVPYIFGLLFLDEPFAILRTLGLILVLTGTIISNFQKSKINTKQIIMCISIFVINGFVSVLSKVHQTENNFAIVNANEFIIIGGLFTFVFAGILYLFFKKKTNQECEKNNDVLRQIPVIACAAVVSGVSYLLQLFGAISLPATVLYPFITGGSVVLSALVSKFFFKEKLSKKLIISILICFMGTVMFL